MLCLTNVEWCEVGEEPAKEFVWSCNQTPPREGEMRWCQVGYVKWEQIKKSTRWWLLFQTGKSLMSGWIDSPKELDALALVEVEILSVAQTTLASPRWFQIRVLRVAPFASIPHLLPALEPPELSLLELNGEPECASEKILLCLDGGEQFHTTRIYVQKEDSGKQIHFVFYRLGFSDKCEIYNWPVK